MTRDRPGRHRLGSAIGALLALGAGCSPTSDGSGSSESLPNIVLVVMDTTRADHLSLYGWRNATTPSLAELSADSVVYTAAHSTAPWTLPSHMSMFTGLLPGEHGATLRIFDGAELLSLSEILARRHRPAAPERMLPVLLQQRGYQTLGFSNNPWISAQMGFDTGFDSFELVPSVAESASTGAGVAPNPAIPLAAALATGAFGRTVQRLNRRIATNGLQPPFFLFINAIDVHFPYLSPPAFRFAFGGDPRLYPIDHPTELQVMAGAASMDFDAVRPFYDASILYADAVIGELMRWLKAAGWYESSLVVITSDHGEHLGEQGRFSHQLSVAEELLHIPLIVKFPNGWRAGQRDASPTVSALDIYATALAAAGVKADRAGALASRNLADPRAAERPFVLAEYYDSRSYLQLFANLNPDFDVVRHRGVRRVIYAGDQRFAFEDSRLVKVETMGTGDSDSPPAVGRARAQRWLDGYVGGLGELSGPPTASEPGDADVVEGLRALGYLE